jgi:hypothetical protein
MAGKSSLRLPVPIQLIACQTREIRRKAIFESAERTKSQQKGVGADLEWLLMLRLKLVPFVFRTGAGIALRLANLGQDAGAGIASSQSCSGMSALRSMGNLAWATQGNAWGVILVIDGVLLSGSFNIRLSPWAIAKRPITRRYNGS